MPPWTKTALKYAILVTAIVAALGPAVAELAGSLPPQWLSVASRIVAAAAAIHLWLTESPLVQPLLQTKSPEKVILAATSRALSTPPPPPVNP